MTSLLNAFSCLAFNVTISVTLLPSMAVGFIFQWIRLGFIGGQYWANKLYNFGEVKK